MLYHCIHILNFGAISMDQEAVTLTPVSTPAPVSPRRTEVEGVFPLMPQQYYDLISRRSIADGERRLMFAVFEDAIRSYVIGINAKSAMRRKEFEEVKAWSELRGQHNVFSFDSLCSHFDIDPDHLRDQLAKMQSSDLPRRRMGSLGRRVPMSAVS
jgi:hypothetical protein